METTFRYCLICERRTACDAEGNCRPCAWWNLLHHMTGAPTLTRKYILANTNDGTEYETPVLDAEAMG